MTLEDTIGLMCSENFKDRMKAEYIQLNLRMGKLQTYMQNVALSTADGQHLREQMNGMKYYRDALRNRMIDLEMNVNSLDSVIEDDEED